MTRPHRAPRTDANHGIVPKVVRQLSYQFRGLPLRLIDTSKAGGNLLDYVVWIGNLAVLFEVKSPGESRRLTDGEQETMGWGIPVALVEDEQGVIDALTKWVLVAVEVVV